MPSQAQMNAFIEQVLANDHLGAIERWYTDDATMQENQHAPRRGRELLLRHERDILRAARSVETQLLGPPIFSEDRAAVQWRFIFDGPDGLRVLDEVAIQDWRDGRIWREQFFYDPKQLSL